MRNAFREVRKRNETDLNKKNSLIFLRPQKSVSQILETWTMVMKLLKISLDVNQNWSMDSHSSVINKQEITFKAPFREGIWESPTKSRFSHTETLDAVQFFNGQNIINTIDIIHTFSSARMSNLCFPRPILMFSIWFCLISSIIFYNVKIREH